MIKAIVIIVICIFAVWKSGLMKRSLRTYSGVVARLLPSDDVGCYVYVAYNRKGVVYLAVSDCRYAKGILTPGRYVTVRPYRGDMATVRIVGM